MHGEEEEEVESNLLKLLRPLHVPLGFIWPMPYVVVRHGTAGGVWRASPAKGTVLRGLLCSLVCVAAVTAAVLEERGDVWDRARARANAVAANVLLALLYVNGRKTTENLNRIARLERKLARLGFRLRRRFRVRALQAAALLYVLAQAAPGTWGLPDACVVSLARVYTGSVLSLHFCCIVLCVYSVNGTLEILNRYLREAAEGGAPLRGGPLGVETARRVYGEIWLVVDGLNANYGVPVTIVCFASFLDSTATLYGWWSGGDGARRNAADTLQWFLVHTVKMLALVLVCDDSKRQGEAVQRSLHKLRRRPGLTDDDRSTVSQFLVQAVHERLEYRACHDMFPINKTLISTVFVAGTTYSILLVQLDGANVTTA